MDFDALAVLGPPGWVELRLVAEGNEKPPRVFAKFEERDGRGVATRLVIAGDTLDSSTLRAIPLGRVESAVNHPKYGLPGGVVRGVEPDVLREMADRGELFPDEFDAIDQAINAYLDKRPAAVPGVVTKRKPPRRPPLTRPDGTDPEGFSRRVAEAYNQAVLTTSAPAKVLAEEAGVPVVTVHRWIADARRRGYLPQARRGRAG